MAKTLKSTKEGQVVLIWIDKNGSVAVSNSKPGVKPFDGISTIPATVIENNSVFGTTLAWKLYELIPNSTLPSIPVPQYWKDKGYIVSQCYNTIGFYQIMCEYLDAVDKDAIRYEHPCKICKRKNDVGIGSCWWCGVNHPTDPTAR